MYLVHRRPHHPEIKSGAEVPLLLLEAYSGSIKRVCRSTLAAEANAFLMGTSVAAEFLFG